MRIKILSTVTLLLCLCTYGASIIKAQESAAFLIGEHQAQYDDLIVAHKTHLLEVCDNSMNDAYSLWVTMLKDMENYCLENGYDIKGVKMWMNVFWDAEGNVKHIVFYPKPNSKHADYDRLKDVLSSFTEVSVIEKKYEEAFSHYGSASFPVMNTPPGSSIKQ